MGGFADTKTQRERERAWRSHKSVFIFTIYENQAKNVIRTLQETYCISATKTDRLMLLRETTSVYFENHTKHITTLWAECKILVR
jgi:hypothetical protein